MPNHRLLTTGLQMPEDFPVVPYEAIHRSVARTKDDHPHAWEQYSAAWNAVAHRFASCAYHDSEFTESILRPGTAPPPPERHLQERALFGFFANGLSTIESFCYGLFAIGAMIDPETFQITTDKQMSKVKPKKTAKKFEGRFAEEGITSALQHMRGSHKYRDWKVVRNILIHRTAPGRTIRLGGPRASPALWKSGIEIDSNTTPSRREWLAETMRTLLNGADVFADRYLSPSACPHSQLADTRLTDSSRRTIGGKATQAERAEGGG